MNSSVPEGWVLGKLGDFCEVIRGVSYKPENLRATGSADTVTLLRSNNIQSGSLNFDDVQFVDIGKVKQNQKARFGDIAVCMSNGSKRLVGKNAVFQKKCDEQAYSVGAFCSIVRTLGESSDKFIAQILQSDQFVKQVEFSLAGSAINNLKDGDLKEYHFAFPPLPQQQKIASILTSVDEVIENTQKQIDKLQDLKKATMNELLTKGIGHTEFKDSELGRIPRSWGVTTIGDLFRNIKVLTSDAPDLPLYSLTIEHGLVPKPDRYVRDFLITNSDKDNYKLVENNNLVMNPMNLRWGAIAAHHGARNVCVSKYYDILELRDKKLSILFYENLFQSKRFLNLYESIATGTLEEKKRVHWSDFQHLKVPNPPREEHPKLQQAFRSVEQMLEVQYLKHGKIQSLKKSLMQDLLTGKVRVSVD